jgi:hypothetical protein
VYTSDIKYAGTDANVDITLFGESNDTGKLRLAKSETNRNMWYGRALKACSWLLADI